MLRLPDRWIWDFWLADTGVDYHVFYLQAPRSLGDEQLRHHNATIGHASSADLHDWRVWPDALRPGAPGAWDDLATWTGSVISWDERWWMFYSAISSREHGRVQRIGAATSTDLATWTKHPANPLIEAEGRWYERADDKHTLAWRDPWVFADPDGDGFHALITARVGTGPEDERGVIGHARSADLVRWEVGPPLTDPGDFGELEVPQLVWADGEPVLVFSCGERYVGRRRRQPGVAARAATYLAPAPGPLGPYDVASARVIAGDGLYSGRIVHDRQGRPNLLAFVDRPDGAFVGELADPRPIDL
jgi:beta-fructofuranosidase